MLDNVIKPWSSLIEYKLIDSFDALDFLKSQDLELNYAITFDASSLYTNISLNLALEALNFYLTQPVFREKVPNRFKNGKFLREALSILFSENYFLFDGHIYKQKEGLSMGTNCAVNIAEISLGYLETKAGFDPRIYRRYIDDGVCIIPKNSEHMQQEFLQKLDSLDPAINWTTDFNFSDPKTVFLDIEITYNPVSIHQYFKPTKKCNSFIPYRSKHRKHTIANLPKTLFDRALTINLDEEYKKLAYTRIQIGLTNLNYPTKVIKNALDSAQKITPKRHTIDFNRDEKIIYLVFTNDVLNRKNPLHNEVKFLNKIIHMDPSGALKNLTLKVSFRQPPSIKSLNNMAASTQKNQSPVKCLRKCCLICEKALCIDKKVKVLTGNNDWETINAARFSCKTRNLVYIIFDKNTKKVFYVGHTGQSLESRIYQHTGGKKLKGGNSKFRYGLLDDNSKNKIFYDITAVRSHPSRVRRLAHEKELIQKLKPSWNIQVEFLWWNNRSNEFNQNVETDNVDLDSV